MKLLKYTKKWLHHESASGMIMILFAALAIIFANSSASGFYSDFINFKHQIFFNLALKDFVKDVLMVFFFFLVGLELKREKVEGFLKDRSQITLPLVAAFFGMVVPAGIFYLFNYNNPELLHGWAIPSATDIAFAVCILLIVAKNFPPAAKIFLLAVAIFDDLGAILIIAFFYSSGINLVFLAVSALIVFALYLLNKFSVNRVLPYILVGGALAYFLHEAGIHTTIAGVITAFAIPGAMLKRSIDKFHSAVNFFILPLFAFVSAGVVLGNLSLEQIFAPVPLGIAAGLFFGKQIGIFGASFACIRSGFAKMPEDSNWLDIYVVSIVAGIGFTMSLFVGMLAYNDVILQEEVKFGVIAGSLLSAIWAAIIVNCKKRI